MLVHEKINLIKITDGEEVTIQEFVVCSIKNFVELCIEVKNTEGDQGYEI